MNVADNILETNKEHDGNVIEKKFIPRGAIAFFILLLLLCLAIWFGIYYIMLSRS